jgi:hypothetical protein
MRVTSGVCRVLGAAEYSAGVKATMEKEKAGAVCVEMTVHKADDRAKAQLKLPLMLYVHGGSVAHSPYCDENRVIGVRRLSTRRIVKSQQATRPTFRAVCSTDPLFVELAHERSAKKRRGAFAPQVANVVVDDEPVARELGAKIASGAVRRVRVLPPAVERKGTDAGRVCTKCSFYYQYAPTAAEPNRPGCYFIYNKGECPHTLALVASGDSARLNAATRVSYKALARYAVTDDEGSVDLARWIYAKFRGTGFAGAGTKGACVSEQAGAPAEAERAMRDPSTTLLLRAHAHLPMRELRVVVA